VLEAEIGNASNLSMDLSSPIGKRDVLNSLFSMLMCM